MDAQWPLDLEEWEKQVLDLLQIGQKLEAVKLYKQQTGLRLLDAKEAVEALQRGERRPPPSASAPIGEIDDELKAEVLRLLGRGEKLKAVKAYRSATGTQLMESKKAVEALAARNGLEIPGSGCLGALTLFALLLVLVFATLLGSA